MPFSAHRCTQTAFSNLSHTNHYHTAKRAKNAAFAPCVKFSYQETISRDCFIKKTLYAREKRVFSGYVGMRL